MLLVFSPFLSNTVGLDNCSTEWKMRSLMAQCRFLIQYMLSVATGVMSELLLSKTLKILSIGSTLSFFVYQYIL